jgi:Protein phosphatase 2C
MQLSMTRALGHNMLADFGVIPVPTVAQRELQPENTCLVVASDGELVFLAELLCSPVGHSVDYDHVTSGVRMAQDWSCHFPGVWDTFSPSEAVELVMYMKEEGQSAHSAAEQLCHEAVERAIDSEDGEADNTSAVVLFFKHRASQPSGR